MAREMIEIGPVIRRRRHDLSWNLQTLADRCGGSLGVSYLSAVETGKSNPSISVVVEIADALGVSVDQLIAESRNDGHTAPIEPIRRVPVIAWEHLTDWIASPDMMRLPKDTPWVVALENPPRNQFALRVRDESMHGLTGVAFPQGSLIHVDPDREYTAGDYVVGYDSATPGQPTFKKLVRDGADMYLRPLNQQYPMTRMSETFIVAGVVVGSTMRLSKGMIIQ